MIYASPTPSCRKLLWKYLDEVKGIVQGPWVIAGDFNEIISGVEKKGRTDNFVSTSFKDWIDKYASIDLGFKGQDFT